MKLLKHKLIYKNRFGYKLWHDTLQEKSKKIFYDYLEREGDYVVIIPRSNEGNLYFVKHFRYAIKKDILELPMGYINKGETPKKAAVRELYEEIGATKATFKYLGYIWQIPGIFKLKCHIFFADNILTNGKSPDLEENLKVVQIKENKIRKLISEGGIEDSSSIVAISKLQSQNQLEGSGSVTPGCR